MCVGGQPPSARHMYGMNGGWRTLEGVSVYSDEGGGVSYLSC